MDFRRLAAFFDDVVAAEGDALSAALHAGGIDPVEAIRLSGLCVGDLRARLFELSHRVLVAHYQVVEQDVAFDDYCEQLRGSSIRDYLRARYPVLRDAMTRTAHAWRQHCALLLLRFHADHPRIARVLLAGQSPTRISSVRSGLGDTHRGGRSVTLLKFEDGRQLLYKPRSLAIDSMFGELTDWIANRGGPALRIARHVDAGSHGWVEFIEHTPCASEAEIAAYYHRLGGLLALLYVLEASDIHHENIIAHGEHPVLIDLESLLRPTTPITGVDANEGYDTSVLKVGILPTRFLSPEGGLPEVGGAADVEGVPGMEALRVTRDEAGRPRLVRARGTLAAAQNLPRLGDRRIPLSADYRRCFDEGFEAVYAVIATHRAELIARLDAMADIEVRVLFRHTATYSHLLSESRHPSLLSSHEATRAHFRLLGRVIDAFPAAADFVDAEIEDLLAGDIPQFTVRAGCRDLVCNQATTLAGFFDACGLDAVRRNLARLGPRDLAQQRWLIANTLEMQAARSSRPAAVVLVPCASATVRDRLLALAVDVGERVRRRIRVCDDEANWLVQKPTSLDNTTFSLEPAFHDLHSGMPGEILLFQQLARVTGDGAYRTLARQALRHLLRRLEEAGDAVRPLGLYAGWGSVVFLLERMARLECDFDLVRRAEALLSQPRFDALVGLDREYSLVSGGAGFIMACVSLHRSTGSDRALGLARACARHLLARRHPGHVGAGWRIHSAQPLSGLAHGASGFAVAFAQLHAVTGDESYRSACVEALAYEQSLFLPEHGNWRDCRDHTLRCHGDVPQSATSWAHGAPGIGLARLAVLDAGIQAPGMLADLEIAVQTTAARGFDAGHSLLAGGFGSIELLLCHSRLHPDGPAGPLLSSATAQLLDQAATGLRLSSTLAEPLGLMPGITGVAYQALRLARPDDVPSVLCGTDAPLHPRTGLAAAREHHDVAVV